jgi:hypothetical protein
MKIQKTLRTRLWLVLSISLLGIVIMFGMLSAGHTLAQTVSDDFNDNTNDKTLWGPDYKYHNGVLKEQKERLEYIVFTPSNDYEYTFRPLITSRGPLCLRCSLQERAWC